MSQVFFCLQPGILAMVRLPATNPAQKLIFLLFTSAEGRKSPLPFWGPSQSFGFYLPPSWSADFLGLLDATQVRLLGTNICWSSSRPLWPTFSLKILSIQTRGIVILSPSSQWDITWQLLMSLILTVSHASCLMWNSAKFNDKAKILRQTNW